jgi:hypothetical protein
VSGITHRGPEAARHEKAGPTLVATVPDGRTERGLSSAPNTQRSDRLEPHWEAGRERRR